MNKSTTRPSPSSSRTSSRVKLALRRASLHVLDRADLSGVAAGGTFISQASDNDPIGCHQEFDHRM